MPASPVKCKPNILVNPTSCKRGVNSRNPTQEHRDPGSQWWNGPCRNGPSQKAEQPCRSANPQPPSTCDVLQTPHRQHWMPVWTATGTAAGHVTGGGLATWAGTGALTAAGNVAWLRGWAFTAAGARTWIHASPVYIQWCKIRENLLLLKALAPPAFWQCPPVAVLH